MQLKNSKKNNIKIFSFFSGAGFLDLGFEYSNYSIVFANEINKDFAKAYKYSRMNMKIPFPKYGLHQEDIRIFRDENKYSAALTSWITEERSHNIVGFIGGPPCPDFSIAGKNRGAKGSNGMLSQIYLDIICKEKPDFFLFENVKGLWRTAKHRVFFDSLIRQAQTAGYNLAYKLVNALEYGVPQDRDRILLFGVSNKLVSASTMLSFNWKSPTWQPLEKIKSLPWPSRNPFRIDSKIPLPLGIPEELTVEYWFRHNDVEQHPNSKDFFIPHAGLPKMETIEEGDDSKKSYKRLHRWRYSPTVAYGNNEVHLHPYKARRISVEVVYIT